MQFSFNYDLGIKKLLPEWKNLFTTRFFLADLTAGVTVACIAIPLSLAIALASDVPPNLALVTAIIAGIVCALFGGSPLVVSGPAAAMSILIATNVEAFGIKAVVLMCLLAGILQLLTGGFGFGRLGRYVPLPVIAGFIAGVGVLIIISQLPHAFGVTAPDQAHLFEVFTHLAQYIHQTNHYSLLLVVLTIFIIRGLPRIFPKLPATLVAVIIMTGATHFFGLSVPLIGEIHRNLLAPHFPNLTSIPFSELFMNTLAICLLASLETLLTSSAVDKLAKGEKHNPDQELIGQGLGNIAVSFFGGIPATGVIARSAINVRAGAKTRRASIIHSLIILLTVFAIAPLISEIPTSVIVGVLFSAAFSMINVKEFRDLWYISRPEAIVYASTFFSTIFFDLISKIQVGIVAAALIVLFKLAKAQINVSSLADDHIVRFSFSGALTFLATGQLNELESKLQSAKANQIFILDLTHITNLDSSVVSNLIDLFNEAQQKQVKFYIKGLPRRFEPLFEIGGGSELINQHYLVSESELRHKSENMKSFRGRLVHGVQQFYKNKKHQDKRLFEYLTLTQDPHTFFITCSDSRIMPSTMTSTDPGELFILRNVGNFIPPYQPHTTHSEAAALEFALTSLHITDLVICGHTSCGAINACCSQKDLSDSPELKTWIDRISQQLGEDVHLSIDAASRKNAVHQLQNLKTYPVIQKRLREKTLNIHIWFFDFENQQIDEWDERKMIFKPLLSPPTCPSPARGKGT